MFQIFCTITDDMGSRTVPTGHATYIETCAYDIADQLKRSYPDNEFWVDWVQADGYGY